VHETNAQPTKKDICSHPNDASKLARGQRAKAGWHGVKARSTAVLTPFFALKDIIVH